MFEKITGYTARIDTLRKMNVITAGSPKLVSLTGNTEERTMVIIKTIFTNISCAQPVVIFFEAALHRGQT
jgi:uncharacterized membrane protein (Fun14 family)